jgi:hypothetical protein
MILSGKLTATPIGMPKLLKNPYMLAVIAQSSIRLMACVPKFTPLRTIPLPTPKTARMDASTTTDECSFSRVSNAQPTVVMHQPVQMAQRYFPSFVVRTETMMEPGRRNTRAGKRSIPDLVGECPFNDMYRSGT